MERLSFSHYIITFTMSTPLTKQKIIDQTSTKLAEKICENMKGSKDFEQSIISITVNSIQQAFEDEKTKDSFTNVLINGIKQSFRFIKGSNILFYSILSDENGKEVYSELVGKALSKSVTHTIEVDNFIDYLISEFNTIIRQKQNFLFENDKKTGGGGGTEIATELAENVADEAATVTEGAATKEVAENSAITQATQVNSSNVETNAATEGTKTAAEDGEKANSEDEDDANAANATEDGDNENSSESDYQGLNPQEEVEVKKNEQKINDLVTGLFKKV